jgi:hypothetical protein
MRTFDYVTPPVRVNDKTPLSPGQELLLAALSDLPEGLAVPIDPAELTCCAKPRNALNSVGRMVRKVRERHFPEQFHRQYWHDGLIYIERTV